VAAGWRGCHIDAPLVYYRRHKQSMSVSSRSIAYEWDARAQIIRKHSARYGLRLTAWATVRCARHAQPIPDARPGDDAEVREIPPPSNRVVSAPLPFAPPSRGAEQISFRRRLIRSVPFVLRFRV